MSASHSKIKIKNFKESAPNKAHRCGRGLWLRPGWFARARARIECKAKGLR